MALSGKTADRESPARSAVAVDVSSTDQALTYESRGVYVGGAGILEVDMAGSGSAVQFTCSAGALLPIQVRKVLNANTTATQIVALY
jgi:hypothetical protein